MIAPNDKKIGRNEPCPCGSKVKYKLCCGDEDIKALRQDHLRQKILAHYFLMQLHKLTGAPVVGIPEDVLKNYPAELGIKAVRDRDKGMFLFAAEPPKEPLIEAPRRIILPR